jgi:hypothetical protein
MMMMFASLARYKTSAATQLRSLLVVGIAAKF